MPEDAYQGVDITEHAKAFSAEFGTNMLKLKVLTEEKHLLSLLFQRILQVWKKDLLQYRIKYDHWFKGKQSSQ